MASRVGYLKKGKVGVCVMCRQIFQCARLDKKTCSDRCRKAWSIYNKNRKRDNETEEQQSSQIARLSALVGLR